MAKFDFAKSLDGTTTNGFHIETRKFVLPLLGWIEYIRYHKIQPVSCKLPFIFGYVCINDEARAEFFKAWLILPVSLMFSLVLEICLQTKNDVSLYSCSYCCYHVTHYSWVRFVMHAEGHIRKQKFLLCRRKFMNKWSLKIKYCFPWGSFAK